MKDGVLSRFLRWCPGAIGILLRQKFYPRLLGSCGRGVLFGRLINFHNAKNIHIGDNAVLSNRCVLVAGSDAGKDVSIVMEENVFIGIGTLLQAETGNIYIKQGTNLGSECRVVARTPVILGHNVLVAAYCVIGEELPSWAEDLGHPATISIGDNVWLGARSQVLSKVHIGEGAIVGAHARVERSVDACGIVMGCPASLVRYRK